MLTLIVFSCVPILVAVSMHYRKEMRKALPALVRQLQHLLHNNQLQIELVQAEYSQEQMAFTSEEKFAVMAEQNPVVNILKERLDLTID